MSVVTCSKSGPKVPNSRTGGFTDESSPGVLQRSLDAVEAVFWLSSCELGEQKPRESKSGDPHNEGEVRKLTDLTRTRHKSLIEILHERISLDLSDLDRRSLLTQTPRNKPDSHALYGRQRTVKSIRDFV